LAPSFFSRHSDSHFNAILIGGVSFVQGKSVDWTGGYLDAVSGGGRDEGARTEITGPPAASTRVRMG
jgi:hypothetical protein